MKKTLIALAVVTSTAVSGSAMAADWVDNMASGTVDFGGTVTLNNPVVWQWKTGAGKTDFSHFTYQMDGNKQNLIINVDKDIPIAAAKLKNAVSGTDLSQSGVIPKVSFSAKDGSDIPFAFTDNNSGDLSFTIKAYNSESNDEIGTLTVNGSAAGSISMAMADGSFKDESLRAPASGVFEGALGSELNQVITTSASDANNLAVRFGAPTLSDIEQQVKAFVQQPDATFDDISGAWYATPSFGQKGYAFSYGLGVKQGKTLDLHFNNPVNATTKWIAPLTIKVAYN